MEQNIEFTSEEIKHIRVFRDTYNALYIKDFSPEKINHIKKNSNSVYQKLIKNLKSDKSYGDYEYIEGPISVSKFKMEADGQPKKSFYIFGEIHRDTRGHCDNREESIDFVDYLYRLSTESPSFIDFYIELPMVKKKIKAGSNISFAIYNSLIDMIENKNLTFESTLKEKSEDIIEGTSYIFYQIQSVFSKCIQPKYRQVKECQIMRIHNIDIRNTWNDINDLPADIGVEIMQLIIKAADFDPENIMHLFRKSASHVPLILDVLNIMEIGNLMDLFLFNESVSKDFESSYEKDNITTFIQKKLNDNFDSQKIRRLSNILLYSILNEDLPTLSKEEFIDFYNICFELSILKVDMYCLLRVFKYYDIYKYNPAGSFQPAESKNIVIYAGDTHSQNYIEFLEYLASIGYNIQKTYSYRNPERKSCVKVNIKPKAKSSETEADISIRDSLTELRGKKRGREVESEYIKKIKKYPISTLKDIVAKKGFRIPFEATKDELISLLEDFENKVAESYYEPEFEAQLNREDSDSETEVEGDISDTESYYEPEFEHLFKPKSSDSETEVE